MRFQVVGRTFALLAILTPAVSWAAPRTFVRSTGLDTNPCTLLAPCRQLAVAIGVTDAKGEVVVQDSAGFVAITVTKAITVVAPEGVYAAVTGTSGNAVTVSAGPSDVVVLKGLTIKGQGASRGILFTSGGSLHVEKCDLIGFNNAIRIEFGGELYVSDTVVRDTLYNGIEANPSSGTAKIAIDRSRIEKSGGCAFVSSTGTRTAITDSHAAGGGWGFCTQADSGTSQLDIRGGSATGMTNTGVGCSGTGAIIHIGGALLSNNQIGLVQSNGCVVESQGNNLVRGNSSADVSGSITTVGGI